MGNEVKTNNENNSVSTSQWWRRRRKHYNVSLVVAGLLAFFCYVLVIEFSQDVIDDADVTLFTTLFQGICYLFAMGIANIIYFAGPAAERVVKPANVDRFRTITYGLGYWFSVLLPFAIPVTLLCLVIFQPQWWN